MSLSWAGICRCDHSGNVDTPSTGLPHQLPRVNDSPISSQDFLLPGTSNGSFSQNSQHDCHVLPWETRRHTLSLAPCIRAQHLVLGDSPQSTSVSRVPSRNGQRFSRPAQQDMATSPLVRAPPASTALVLPALGVLRLGSVRSWQKHKCPSFASRVQHPQSMGNVP